MKLRLMLAVMVGTTAFIASSASSVAHVAARPTNTSLSRSAGQTIAGEAVEIKGKAAPKHRVVTLQKRRHGKWVRSKSARSHKAGKYSFPVVATRKTVAYRVYAPKAVSHPALTSKVTKVRGRLHATASLSLLPVAKVAKASTSSVTAAARLTPARPGRPVQVRRYSGGRWSTVARGKQSGAGTFSARVPLTSGAKYVVRTRLAGGAWVTSGQVSSSPWNLGFHDEFSGTALDTNKWYDRQVGETFGLRTKAAVAKNTRSVANGALTMKVRKSRGLYRNAMLASKSTFTYGYAAARVKFQSQAGAHAGFWLQANKPATATTPNRPAETGAEIDVAEYYGDNRPAGGLGSSVNWWTSNDKSGNPVLTTVGGEKTDGVAMKALHKGNLSTGYHTFAVEWTKTSYTYLVDDQVVFQTSQGVSGQPECLLLSLLTSDWELKGHNPAGAKASVDWVRVWQH